MKNLIIEGNESFIDKENDEEEKYIFMGSVEERKSLLELTVELRSDSSRRILLLARAKYLHT